MVDCSVKIWRPKWYRRTGWRLAAFGLVAGLGIGTWMNDWARRPSWPAAAASLPNSVSNVRPNLSSAEQFSRRPKVFGRCGSGSASDCVIDGDTFRYEGEKIRIADIDAPETAGARCQSEAVLGARATERLAELLSRDDFAFDVYPGRDRDQYGRLLRVVTRHGASIGETLVSEGLARRWQGRRRPWC